MANLKIKWNEAVIAKVEKARKDAFKLTGQLLLTDLVQSQTMPFDTGEMQNSRTFVENVSDTEINIRTAAPQARRLYFHPEYNFQKGHNPNAGGLWFDPYLPGGTSEKVPEKLYADLLKRRLR